MHFYNVDDCRYYAERLNKQPPVPNRVAGEDQPKTRKYIADATDIGFPFKKNGEQKSVLHYIYIGMLFLKKTITLSKKDIIS